MVTPRVADLPAALSALPAHGVGSRQDLPLPFTAVVIGAAFALVVSFVALGVLWHEPRLGRDDGIPLPRWAAALLDSRVLRDGRRGPDPGPDRVDPDLPGPRPGRRQQPRAVRRLRLAVGRARRALARAGPGLAVVNPIRWLHRAITRVARLDPDSALTDWSPG